jgi:hypothetical protein
MAVVGSVVAGALIAVLAAFGGVSAVANSKPAPVDKPLIVYGQR